MTRAGEKLKHGRIDAFWKGMLLIEHKSRGADLVRAFAQAADYFDGIFERDLPRYILVSDFERFRLYDLEDHTETAFKLADLHKHIKHFGFVAGYLTQVIAPQNPVNIKAAERMGRLHTFQWSNEARGMAAVHCVIIGFGTQDIEPKAIYEYKDIRGEPHAVPASHINPYLVDGPDVVLINRLTPISRVPEISYGSFALDDGNYTLSEEDRDSIVKEAPHATALIRSFIGGRESAQ